MLLGTLGDYLKPLFSKEPYNPQRFSNYRLRSSINRRSYDDAAGPQNDSNANLSAPPAMNNATEAESTDGRKQVREMGKREAQWRDASGENASPHFEGPEEGGTGAFHAPMRPGATYVSKQERPRTTMCYEPPPSENTMGCWMFPNSQRRIERRMIDTIQSVPGTETGDIRVLEANEYQNDNSMTPKWSKFDDSLYSEPVLDSERRHSSGVLVNTFTGKMIECFEEDMPPPNTDKEIAREQFEHTNPRLTMLNGGIDPNRKRPNKKEVMQNLPRKDDGPNVWGDQLYAPRRRQEIQTRVNRDMWMNRNGDHSVEAFDDRKPVGYVGFQRAYRPLPYMPPTQRTSLASRKGWTGIPSEQVPAAGARDQIFPRHFTRRPDASTCSRGFNVDATNEAISEYVVLPDVEVRDTNRQTTGTVMVHGIVDGTHGDANLVHSGYHENVRPPLTEEEEMLTLGATSEVKNGVVVVDPTSLRATMKAAMEGTFASTNASSANTGANVIIDREARPTLKTMMQDTFPTTSANGEHTSNYVLLDKDARPTQKTMMQETFPTTTANGEHAANYVLLDKDARPTLKTMMQDMFPTANAGNENTGEYIEFQGEILPTNRMHYETEGHRPSAHSETVGTNTTVDAEFAHIDPTRGTSDTNWMNISRVPAETEDTSTRWMPTHTQETERSMQARMPVPTKRSMQEHRVMPTLNTTSCAAAREDASSDEIIRWNPTYYTEATLG